MKTARVQQINQELKALEPRIRKLKRQESDLLNELEVIQAQFATHTEPVSSVLKKRFEKQHPSLLAGDERPNVVSRDLEIHFNPGALSHELRAEVNESAAEDLKWGIRQADPYDEDYLELDSETYSIECATFVGIAALHSNGKVSVFTPFADDTEAQARQRAKRWRKKRESAQFFGYYFGYRIYDDDGAILENRALTIYPI